jgi:hypothetical protein
VVLQSTTLCWPATPRQATAWKAPARGDEGAHPDLQYVSGWPLGFIRVLLRLFPLTIQIVVHPGCTVQGGRGQRSKGRTRGKAASQPRKAAASLRSLGAWLCIAPKPARTRGAAW